jgi:hypothetical protein
VLSQIRKPFRLRIAAAACSLSAYLTIPQPCGSTERYKQYSQQACACASLFSGVSDAVNALNSSKHTYVLVFCCVCMYCVPLCLTIRIKRMLCSSFTSHSHVLPRVLHGIFTLCGQKDTYGKVCTIQTGMCLCMGAHIVY